MTAASVAGPDDEKSDVFIRRITLRNLLSFGPDAYSGPSGTPNPGEVEHTNPGEVEHTNPEEVEHGIREVEHGIREVEHRFRRKWNIGSGGRERSSVA